MRSLFERSRDEHFPLEIIYLSDRQQLSQRKIHVQEVSEHTIRAYCFLRKQTRLFKMANILSVQSLQQREPHIS